METNNVDATVDFVDIGVQKQDSAVREGQSDANTNFQKSCNSS